MSLRNSKDGYTSASGKTSFDVICKTFSRGCPNPPNPQPPNRPHPTIYHSNNNGITTPPTTLQFQKYFKEFIDMPANSPLYIASTSMHKDTLNDIIITGEIKNIKMNKGFQIFEGDSYIPTVIDSQGNVKHSAPNAAYTMTGNEKYVNSGWLLPKGQEQNFPGSSNTFTVTFQKAGTYNYLCLIHPWMQGSVIVK